jgi:hypothetical protein
MHLGPKIWIKIFLQKNTPEQFEETEEEEEEAEEEYYSRIPFKLDSQSISRHVVQHDEAKRAKCLWKVNICDVGVWKTRRAADRQVLCPEKEYMTTRC